MTDEAQIEAAIQARGLTAPRITPETIDATIVGEAYHVFPGTTLTVCALTLRNGFIVTGESAAASFANFDPAIGRAIARRNARDKIWALEGYLLREELASEGAAPSLRAAVRMAANTFEAYAQQHLMKGTEDGDRKAEANRKMVAAMHAALRGC